MPLANNMGVAYPNSYGLHNIIHCGGKNAFNYIITCKWLFIDNMTPKKLNERPQVGEV